MRCVAGVRIDDELRIGDVLRKRERSDGRNHDVLAAVHNEGRLRDGLEFSESLAAHLPPFGERRDLGRHRLRGAWWIDIILAQMTSFPEGPARGLAARRWRKKQIQEAFEPALRGRGMLHDLGILRWLTRAGPGAHQHQTPDEPRM